MKTEIKKKMIPVSHIVKFNTPFHLENNEILPEIEIAYTTYGKINANGTNVVWICHALTANANPTEWWPGLVGENDVLNPNDYFIVCANVLGSCYGTTGPLHINPKTNNPYYSAFPFISVRDMVNAHALLADYLQLKNIHLLLGGSLGGQQVLEWSIAQPERIKNQILLATNAFHSPYGIAFNESQRLAIYADKTYFDNVYTGGNEGLKAARSIALISYRTYGAYTNTQQENDLNKINDFKAASYQQYQGEKLVNRFNAYSYVSLSKTMDSHNVARNRGNFKKVLSEVKANTICIGISSDILFPPIEQQFLQQHIPLARYVEIDSFYGHDGFLIETKQLTEILKSIL